MNPFVRYSLAVAMGSTVAASVFAAEETDTQVNQDTPQAEAELTSDQQATLDQFEQQLAAAINEGIPETELAELISSAIASNPELAASIQSLAANTQAVSQEVLTAAVIQGLSQAPETAAGNPPPAPDQNTPENTPNFGATPPTPPQPTPGSTGGGLRSASGG